jgi:hypothetical protein
MAPQPFAAASWSAGISPEDTGDAGRTPVLQGGPQKPMAMKKQVRNAMISAIINGIVFDSSSKFIPGGTVSVSPAPSRRGA